MTNFASKYPALAALIGLVSNFGKDMAVQNETVIQKLEGSISLVPSILAFIPQASLLGAEVSALKASPTDLVSGAELLVTDLAFTSEKAQAIITAAFPLAESLAALVPQVGALTSAIKA